MVEIEAELTVARHSKETIMNGNDFLKKLDKKELADLSDWLGKNTDYNTEPSKGGTARMLRLTLAIVDEQTLAEGIEEVFGVILCLDKFEPTKEFKDFEVHEDDDDDSEVEDGADCTVEIRPGGEDEDSWEDFEEE
jgi:hypothetical protein